MDRYIVRRGKSFKEGMCKDMPFGEFRKHHAKGLRVNEMEKVWKELGGTENNSQKSENE